MLSASSFITNYTTDDDGNAADPAPFPSMVVIYNGERVKDE